MLWLKKLNFMETAKLEMELMKALDAGEDLDVKLKDQQRLAEQTKDAEQVWKLEVWQKNAGAHPQDGIDAESTQRSRFLK
jgi:hypothetical protein